MKYLKLFQTIADKQAAELDYPNTNYVVENSKASIERGEPIETRLIAVYNVTSTTEPTRILSDTSNITTIIVDGVQQPSVTTDFTFDTTGEHTVKYEINSNWNGNRAFKNCSGLTSITIPNSVTSIGDYAFFRCSGLTSVSIGSGVISIGRSAFYGCSITDITIPDGVRSIGDSAFHDCRSLTSITIPDSVTSIGEYAFRSCSDLISVTAKATTPPTMGTQVFNDTNNCPIYVPSASVNAYKTAANWSTYASRIQAIQ